MKIIDGEWFSGLPLRSATDLFVVHWTGGEATGNALAQAARVRATLVDREDSVHFVCATDGTIVQLAPIGAHCVHAGSGYNDRSVGIEVVCPGSSGATPAPGRPEFSSIVHGSPVEYSGFFPAQVKAVAQLAQAVLWRYGIAYVNSPVLLEDRFRPGFRGVVGHYQLSSDKLDPGPETMYQIRSALVDAKIGGGLIGGIFGWGSRFLLTRAGR